MYFFINVKFKYKFIVIEFWRLETCISLTDNCQGCQLSWCCSVCHLGHNSSSLNLSVRATSTSADAIPKEKNNYRIGKKKRETNVFFINVKFKYKFVVIGQFCPEILPLIMLVLEPIC